MWSQLLQSVTKVWHAVSVRGKTPDSDCQPVPLHVAGKNRSVRVVRVVCREGGEVQRLCEMGLTTGCHLQVLRRRRASDAIVVRMGDSRLCLDPAVAQHFWVQQTPE